jgi:nucleoside-diphosphate-sugar epimerase
MSGRRVIVTGAAGFVAAATVRRLLDCGHTVLAWVRPASDLGRLAALRATPALSVLALDVTAVRDAQGREAALDALRAFQPDAIVHAAWRGIRGADRDDPMQADNVAVTMELMRVCAEAGTRRFVGLGSQAEYGPQAAIIDEQTFPRPNTLYGAAKLACGTLALAMGRRLGISAAWARVFSVYGPGERSGALIPDLVTALAAGRPYELGACEGRWDYLYQDDAASALEALALRDDAEGAFNLASGAAVPLRDVVLRIRDLVAPGAAIVFGTRSPPPGAVLRLEASVRRIQEATGWRARVTLEEGLARTVAAMGPESGRPVTR